MSFWLLGNDPRDDGGSASRVALRVLGGPSLSYADLREKSARLANWFRSSGLRPGDHVAYMLENRCEALIIAWAAQRAGLYYTPIATHLKKDEAWYIAEDCDAVVVIFSEQHSNVWRDASSTLRKVRRWVGVDAEGPGIVRFCDAMSSYSIEPLDKEIEGAPLLYSSGTTGRPKGVYRPLSGLSFGEEAPQSFYKELHAMGPDTVYLCPGPLYHAAPLRSTLAVQRLGGSVTVMSKFDAKAFLESIERLRVTHVQVVPTMMHRILELPEEVRRRSDVSSLRRVIHAAAPCPVHIKQAWIDWLGPIVTEYYGATEGAGMTYISSAEWLAHRGSVGRAVIGDFHVMSADGAEAIAPGEPGHIYFSGGPCFEYYKAEEKTAEARNVQGWVTLGDIGRVDEDGYLYLVDRKSFTIISGGVNIYPAEIERVLLQHENVREVAVFGVPNADFGEEVKAVIQPCRPPPDPAVMERALIEFCRARLSSLKCPRSVDFIEEMPRSESGKVLKSELRRPYWVS